MEQILIWVASFTAFATVGVPFVIEFIFKWWQPENKVLNSVVTFLIALACAFATYAGGLWFGVGFLVDASILEVLVTGLGAGFLANWSWINVEWIKAIIRLIIGGDPTLFSQKRVALTSKKK